MNMYILLGAVLSLVLTGCTQVQQALSPQSSNTAQVGAAVYGTPAPSPTEIQGSLFSLLNSGDKKCTWSNTVEGRKVDGTAYVSGAKIRAEIQTNISLLPVTANAVGDGKTFTAWVSGLAGQKMSFSYPEVERFMKEATTSAQKYSGQLKQVEQFLQNNTFRCEHVHKALRNLHLR